MPCFCVLNCFSPVPEITWRRANGVPFPGKVKRKNSNVVLEIPSFQQEDAGGYECEAKNKMGRNTVSGRLSFHGTFPVGCVWCVLFSRHTSIQLQDSCLTRLYFEISNSCQFSRRRSHARFRRFHGSFSRQLFSDCLDSRRVSMTTWLTTKQKWASCNWCLAAQRCVH